MDRYCTVIVFTGYKKVLGFFFGFFVVFFLFFKWKLEDWYQGRWVCIYILQSK